MDNLKPYSPLDMLLDCFEIVQKDKLYSDPELHTPENVQTTTRSIYEDLITWIAVRLEVEVQIVTKGFQLATHDALDATFSVDLLRTDMWDWLGELAKIKGIQLSGTDLDRQEAAMFSRLFERPSIQDRIVLDPNVGTARVILSYAKEEKDSIIFYGVEKDSLAYRTALVNMHIYKIRAFLLNANPDIHELHPQSQNWLSANSWYPLSAENLLELITN